MKRLLLITLMGLYSVAGKSQSQVYIDILGGHKGLTSEFFFLENIDKAGRWSIISRSELHLPEYETTTPRFVNYNTFSYNFKNHFGITAGTYASSIYPFSARLGLGYLRENEKFLVYANLSSAVTKNPDAQMLVILGYLPELSEHWRLVTRAELRSAVSYEHGHTFSTQLVKLGLQYKEKIGFGAGAEFGQHTHAGHTESEINIGPFIRVNF